MAEADAKHGLAFIPFDCPVYPLAVFVTHFSANVRCENAWLLAGCELVTHNLIFPFHVILRPRIRSLRIQVQRIINIPCPTPSTSIPAMIATRFDRLPLLVFIRENWPNILIFHVAFGVR